MPKTYTTIQGDMWDTVAYKIYSNEKLMAELIEANPAHRNTIIFSGGVSLTVPDVEVKLPSSLPPWKR